MALGARYAGTNPRVLLTSVFGPYARDDEYGSRAINPMELFHNQVTRVQGPFSLRMFHASTGLIMIMENISAPCTLLDFPDLDRFIAELKGRKYDIIGISAIIPNIGKVKKMCELIRQYQPHAVIVVGGHVANTPDIARRIDADHIVMGEGVRWFREFLGEDATAPVKHPAVLSATGARILGLNLREQAGDVAAVLIPTVGCPLGCNFCATSHFFGGKGKSYDYFTTGEELFAVLCDLERKLRVRSFFVMDENFLLNKKRALRLLELMEKNGKAWSFSIFSSASALCLWSDEELIRFGISWVWMGLEGRNSQYAKLNNIDSRQLVARLQAMGIRVLGSTIIGLEDHTPGNIDEVINWAVSHHTVFHQFMLYFPIPGTPLYAEHQAKGLLLSEEECPFPDQHGQYRFNFRHPHIKNGQETEFLNRAFEHDFVLNGPSLLRLIRTMLAGWQKLKDHANPNVRDRVRWEYKELATSYAGATWAMARWYRRDPRIAREASRILQELYDEFGMKTRLAAMLIGPYIYVHIVLEAKRLARGWTYEPSTIYLKNEAARKLDRKHV